MGGIRYTTGSPDRPPARSGISLGDALASLFSVIGAISAVHERSRSGRGQEVDVAIYEAVFALMESLLADHAIGGVVRQRSGSVLPGVAPSNVYPTADGEDLVLAGNADTVFQRLVALMGRPELSADPDYATHHARGANAVALDDLIASWTSQYKSTELLALLTDGGVPAGLINTAATIMRDEHFIARDMIVWRQADEWNVPMNGVVPKFSRTPGSIRDVGPALGAHTDEVLSSLAGVDGEELARLHEDGVV